MTVDRESALARAYLWHRQNHNTRASASFAWARNELSTTAIKRYPNGVGHKFGGNWQPLDDMGKYQSMYTRAYYCDQWPEGWRRQPGSVYDVCLAEASCRMNHKGWYTDDDCGETISGYALQLPARNGVPQYVPGYASTDSCGVTLIPLDRYDDPLDCASAADSYAEKAAECEREYNAAWQAAQEALGLETEIREARQQFLNAASERRQAKRATGLDTDTLTLLQQLTERVREDMLSYLNHFCKAREKRDSIMLEWDHNAVFLETYEEGV